MKIDKSKFGLLSDGTKVTLYTVSNGDMQFSCTDYGCTITSILLKGKNGKQTEVTLGFSTLDGYVNNDCYFGAFVGRFANRIAKAQFTLNGKKYELDKNDGPNCLHGGFDAWNKIVWDSKIVKGKNVAGIQFSRLSPDGEQGFPGNVEIKVTYLLDKNNNLTCSYTAKTDKATPINFTNHSYFNLAGKGNVCDHVMQMNSAYYLEVSPKLIPTGKLLDVAGTPFDFNTPKTLGQDIDQIKPGYDHCYVTEIYNEDTKTSVPLDDSDLVEFCKVTEPTTGHEMQVFTNLVGCQLYTGNFIQDKIGRAGKKYNIHDGFCLETQCFPDTPNQKDFPTCVLEPGQTMKAKTVYSFKI